MTTITNTNQRKRTAKRSRSPRPSPVWTLALTAEDGTSVVAPITHPAQQNVARKCQPAAAKEALTSMKGHSGITVDHVEDLALEALEAQTAEMLEDVVAVWRAKKL